MSVRVHVHISFLCKADCDHIHVFLINRHRIQVVLINLTVIMFVLCSQNLTVIVFMFHHKPECDAVPIVFKIVHTILTDR